MKTVFTLHRPLPDRILLVLTRREAGEATTQVGHMFTNEEPMYLRLDTYMQQLETSLAEHDRLKAGGAPKDA